MDFIRAAIKGLFYKYPIDRAALCATENRDDLFMSSLQEVLRWENPQFTTTEIGVLEDVIAQTWMKPYKRNFPVEGIPFTGRALFVLFHFGNDIFDTSSWSCPILQYDHLLRWRDVSYYVGEDLLTIPFLADQDSVKQYNRSSFVWENVIRHNNKSLNDILDQGLSEVHSHINASTDVFELNWIRLMNEVCQEMVGIQAKKRLQRGLNDYRQNYSPIFWDSRNDMTLYEWSIVAAAIRTLLYRVVIKKDLSYSDNMALLNNIIKDKIRLYEEEENIVATIGSFEENAFRLPNGQVFDYAITKGAASKCKDEEIRRPYFIHQGERELLYRYFRMLTENVGSVAALAPYVYLYLLIKNHYRTEFVQTNPLTGFENFQRYQKRKSLYLNKSGINNCVNFKYAIQTSLRDIEGEKLESRMAPEQVGKRQMEEYKKSIFEDEFFYLRQMKEDDLSFVVHFLKRPDNNTASDGSRHASFRVDLQRQMRYVVSLCIDKPVDSDVKGTKIVGIDAAGAELDCRPEVFAPSFRYAQLSGLNNITYHAGEDFYDLIDGLRTIDEAMLFMNYQRGCRIGHALALGIDPNAYYGHRHRNTIMPIQVMLDNLVWLYYKARQMNVELRPATLDFIDTQTHILYQEIGYDGVFDQFIYWQSMLLRGDSPECQEDLGKEQELSPWERAARCHHPLCNAARKIKKARQLWIQYDSDKLVKTQGGRPCSFVLPKSIICDVEAIQEEMMDEVERRGIFIESNPSSNLNIGPFEKYEELPIWRFHNVGPLKRHSLNLSINTDDKGVFATSLYNEYSLVSLAMMKKKNKDGNPMWTPKEVLDYIENLVVMGHSQRFKPVKVWVGD